MDSNPNIKIFVSGHKACVLPTSKLYVPMQVGAANASARLKGMTPDDQGDNISRLNGSFSELTAQYWAWRNTESDYVGACHYRRYFCFDNEKHADFKNDHMQIEIDRLCPASIEEYNIDNEELIRKVVVSYDAVVPEEWDVGTTMTPQGVKTTVRDHMKGYGLIKDAAYELLERIVNERYPEYAEDLHDYLYGKMYLGYSCFVMRRELFERMCAFEFDVLMEFTGLYDDPDRTSTQMRLGGYLGEILFSTFILHVKREGASIAHYPLTFFFETDPLLDAGSSDVPNESVHHIIWETDGYSAMVVGVCAKTLVAALPSDEKWEISIAVRDQSESPVIKRAIGDVPENVVLQFISKPIYDTRRLGLLGRRAMERNPQASAMCLAPWLLGQWDDVLFLQGAVLFNSTLQWKGFVSTASKSNLLILAAQDVYASAELNCGANMAGVELAERLSITARDLRDYSTCYMHLSMLRETNNQDEIARKALAVFDVAKKPFDELNSLDQTLLTNAIMAAFNPGELSLEFFYPVAHETTVSSWCYVDVASAWKRASAVSAPVVFYTKATSPFDNETAADSVVFWQFARSTSVYEQLLVQMMQEKTDDGIGVRSRWKNALFPEGTKRRSLARRSLSVVRKFRR